MKTNNFIKLLLVIGVLFLTSCGISNGANEAGKAFTLNDLSGIQVNLDDYLGKQVVVLNFFTTWCPSCNEEVPVLNSFYEAFKDKLSLYAISVGESKAKVSSFVEKKSVVYPVLLDEKSSVASLYGVKGVPTIIVIDIDKSIKYYGYDIEDAKIETGKLIK